MDHTRDDAGSVLQHTDGPFFLKGHDESTRVKAMARSLKTPDSGLGPGLYQTAPASQRHVPQVVLGMYGNNAHIIRSSRLTATYSVLGHGRAK